MTRAFPRKEFLTLVGGSGLLTVLGCAAEDPAPDPTGGAGGMSGGAGASGSSGSGGTAGGGAAGGGAGGTSGGAGTGGGAGKGGGGAGGGAGSGGGGQGGTAGSQAGGGGAGSGGGGAGSGGSSGGGQGGAAGSQAGGGNGGAQGGSAGGGAGGAQGGSGGGGGDACSGEIEAEISMNHGHELTIPMADIMAGVAKVYNAQGTSMHPHYVELTEADFAALRSGGTIKKVSCNGGDHEYVLSCGTASETAGNPMCMMDDMCGSMMGSLCPDP